MDELNQKRSELSAQDLVFERELQAALQRVEAPEAMLSRILQAAQESSGKAAPAAAAQSRVLSFEARSTRPLLSSTRWKSWMGGAVAAVLAIGVFTAEGVHRHRERVQAEQQFAEAQAITERTLEHAREQLERAGVSIEQ